MSLPKLSEVAGTPAIECLGVRKHFYYYEHRTTTLREWFIRAALRKPIHVRHPLFSLTGFNLSVGRGESVALVGSNGSGKSTALRLMAGIYKPSEGIIRAHGRIAAVIELGVSFHMELTGAENVRLYAMLMGLSRKQVAIHFEEIVEFSGIRKFIEVPVKYYSSGMSARLAFSVAVCVQPDVLLVDEVLAVGDQEFRERCLDRLRLFHEQGGTLVTASHDFGPIRELCSRAVWLDQGQIRMQGKVKEVLDAYQMQHAECRETASVRTST
jgi:ABC-type polysaccharide/polyol phosphate transport system ATPase subunit